MSYAATARAEDGLEFDDSGVSLELVDGRVKFDLGGRLHLDAMAYDEDDFGSDDDSDVRRARLELSGRLGEKLRIRVDREFTDDEWNNVWASYEFVEDAFLRGGQFIPPFSMEDLQSSNNLIFMERSLPQAFAPSYMLGGELRTYGRNWTAAGGAFSDPIDSETDSRDTNGDSLMGRFTYDPDIVDGQIFHFGLGAEWRFLSSGSDFQISSRPEAFLAPQRLVNTGNLAGVEQFLNVSLEASWQDGPVMAQAQYVRMMLDRENRPNPSFDGWYVEGSWVVTGERRAYSRSTGLFGAVTPDARWGAWELRARYSVIDLTDKTVSGGVERDIGAGATWWITEKMRVMAEYINADADPDFDGDDRTADIFQARVQIAF